VTPVNKRLLDALVESLPFQFDALFEQAVRYEGEKGACVTYSQILAEILGEYGIKATVIPVYVITANRPGLDYLNGKISESEAQKRRGKVQIWGDISQGTEFQHAVCYISQWDVIVDLGMARRGSGLVPSHPYWATRSRGPWWLYHIEYRSYPLENRAYALYPEKVAWAKEIAREVIWKWL
jgi:hypothetical protein